MAKFWRVTGPNKNDLHWVEDDGVGPYRIHGRGPVPYVPTRAREKTLRKSIELLTGKNPRVALTTFKPGEYHPRMWQPSGSPSAYEAYHHEWSSAVLGGRNLFEGMKEVFRHVEPAPKNWKAFGHEIRQLLVLACIEVEAQCKAVLRANGYKKVGGGHWNMHDYFKLARPMRLAGWSVQPFRYPALGWFKPFRAWSGSAFKPLPWYSAYNAVKHDREIEFERATLGNMFEAMCAVYLIVYAQFGQFGIKGYNYRELDEFSLRAPEFALNEHYVPPHAEQGVVWHAKHYF